MADPLPLQRIAAAFVRYANLTFGGGSATIAVLHRELVEKRGWIDEPGFGLCYALSRLTPGDEHSRVLYCHRMVAEAHPRVSCSSRGVGPLLTAGRRGDHVLRPMFINRRNRGNSKIADRTSGRLNLSEPVVCKIF